MTHRHGILIAILALAPLHIPLGGCSSPQPADDGGPDGGADGGPAPVDAGVDGGQLRDSGEAPDSGPLPECDTGEMRTAGCGFCGNEAQSCEEPGVWVPTSECLGQGECAAGTAETRDLGLCEQEQRICLDGCTWSTWERIRGPGVCEPGETRRVVHASCPPTERLVEQCNDSCAWEEGVGTCVDPCGPAPLRTTPEWAREVCVPDGEFVRGMDDVPAASPMATIYVSTFHVDVYPVTYRRFNQCVLAGACSAPDGAFARTAPEFIDYPVQGISRDDAVAFCTWDGGRRLVTEAEWQKAARGPAPRTNRYPWGDALDCSIVDAGQAPCRAPVINDGFAEDPYDAFGPLAASYYGAQMMGFGASEWVCDAYCFNWYSEPDSRLPDPLCEPSHPTAVAGYLLLVSGYRESVQPVYRRGASSRAPEDDSLSMSFRCGRRP